MIVFAAASLTTPFEKIAQVFETSHPGLKISLVFAGSQQLATQIREGARADVFASANQSQMDAVVEAGLAEFSQVERFTSTTLVVVIPKDNPAGMDDLQNLAQPGRRIILAAAEVPVGQYSLQFLARAGQAGELGSDYQANVLRNVVSYENDVKAVLAKVLLGEADAGIVYASDIGPEIMDRVSRIAIPDRWNITAVYPISVLKEGAQPEMAAAFVDFVLSPEGQTILSDHGFRPVQP